MTNKLNKTIISLITPFIIFSIFSCSDPIPQDPEHVKEIDDWHAKRIENLKKETGWLNLVGLFWLEDGKNKIGSDKSMDIIFPEGKADDYIGTIIKSGEYLTFITNPASENFSESKRVKTIALQSDNEENTTYLTHKTLKWHIIKRGDRYGIRLKDLEAELLTTFKGIERYPVSLDWKIEAETIPYDTPKQIIIPSIIGTKDTVLVENYIQFVFNGNAYKLDPQTSGNRFFIIFADETNGKETYGAGRFLYVDGPDSSSNKFTLDFNKAYNPPCAFTEYATCPLPPKDNYLKLEIEAGEKNWGNH